MLIQAATQVGAMPLPATGPQHQSKVATIHAALLTGGGDRPYVLGLADALLRTGIGLDVIGSDELDAPLLQDSPGVNFLNLRGDQRSEAGTGAKVRRVLRYYARLIRYAADARPHIFHILWNNRFETFDRTLLMWYYRSLGKRVVLTAHNVNAGKRDGNDSSLNRLTLRTQYRSCDHIFVHTARMRLELVKEFRIPERRVTVIPFGINNTLPTTAMTRLEARRTLGLAEQERALLFFGNIAPYKGLEYLVAAFSEVVGYGGEYRLIIAGRSKGPDSYWARVQTAIRQSGVRDRTIEHARYIPDSEVEIYFKAADVLVLPYTHVFQSGVLFLGYSFGLPVIAFDVGSMQEEILDGETGFVCPAQDSGALAGTIRQYFQSVLFGELEQRRLRIRRFANDKYSWDHVGTLTAGVYRSLI